MKTKRFKLENRKAVLPIEDILSDEELEERRRAWSEWKSSGKRNSKVKVEKPTKTRIARTHKIHDPTLVCSGITKKGLPCKNKTKNQTGYCHIH
jgi:hypothetical protein